MARLRRGIGQSLERSASSERELKRLIAELEQLAGDQALCIRAFKKEKGRS